MLLFLLKISLQCWLEVLVLSIIGSDTNTSGQHFPLYEFAGSQGSYLACFRQVPVGCKTGVSKAYVQLGCFSYTATDGLLISGIIEGEGKVFLVIMFAEPLWKDLCDRGEPQAPPQLLRRQPALLMC